MLCVVVQLMIAVFFASVEVKVVSSLAYAPNFISKIIESDILHHRQREGQKEQQKEECDTRNNSSLLIRTRFPPEPNGYLHLGHAKAVCFNYAMARQFGGKFHMRMDDTNPLKETEEYVASILEDVQWILSDTGGDSTTTQSCPSPPWDGPVRATSAYFHIIEQCAQSLLETGDAFIDSSTPEQIREYRGTLLQPGRDSPYKSSRSIADNLQLFLEMKQGQHPPGSHVVRAKINMASPNINLRDPILYRILPISSSSSSSSSVSSTNPQYQLLPMYDFSHPIADALEGITHSLCSLEFEDHRPFYEWTLQKLYGRGIIESYQQKHILQSPPPTFSFPKQIEFSRLNLKYTVLSKRKLIQLVQEKLVNGWSDPRMPTISGVRRRGIPPQALQLFNERNGISKVDSFMEMSGLEDATREVMDKICPRAFGILHPLCVTLSNYPTSTNENETQQCLEYLQAPSYPTTSDNSTTTNPENSVEQEQLLRTIPFGPKLYIEQEDFFDTEINGPPPKGWKRLLPGGMVRLKYAYVITCDEVRRDPKTNQPIELICSYDISTRGGKPPSSSNTTRPGIIHWLESSTAVPCQVNLYDRLFQVEEPGSSDSLDTTSYSSSSQVDNEDNQDKIDPPTKDSFLMDINPNSLEILRNCYVEPSVQKDAIVVLSRLQKQTEERNDQGIQKIYASDLSYQWERNGYFALEEESTADQLIFNRVVTLRDTWNKIDVGKITQVRNRGTSSLMDQRNPLVDEIGRINFRTGRITSVQTHPNASSLTLCTVSCSDESHPRTAIVGNIPIDLLQDLVHEVGTSSRGSVGAKDVIVVTNLKPAKLVGIESTATLLVASTNSSSTENGTGIWEILTTSSSVENIQLRFEHCGEPQPDEMLKNKGALKVWDRVKAALKINEDGEVVYCNKDGKECRLLTGKGDPVVLQRIRNGIIQ